MCEDAFQTYQIWYGRSRKSDGEHLADHPMQFLIGPTPHASIITRMYHEQAERLFDVLVPLSIVKVAGLLLCH